MPSIDVDLNTHTHELDTQEDATECSPHEAMLNDLQNQVRIIGKIKPRLSEIAAEYQQRKSRIDQWAEWYSDKSWAEKVWIGGVVVSVSYVIGVFLGAPLLLAGLVTALYSSAVSIIEEHAEIVRQRDTLFLDDIIEMEASLTASIESFRSLEGKLTTAFESLHELIALRADGIAEFEEGVDVMGEHNLCYTSLIESLCGIAEILSAHQDGVVLDKAELDGLCTELQNRLQEAEVLTSTLSGLVSTVDQELKHHASPGSLEHKDEVEAPCVSEKTAAHFSEIEREIALHRKSRVVMNSRNTAHDDQALSATDQEIQKLLQENNARKARRQDKNPGGIVLTMPSLF